MLNWARPMSTLIMEAWVFAMFPRVEPPGMSERLAKRCTGTPARWQIDSNAACETPSLVYFWAALNLTTTPPFSATRFSSSYFSGWVGWTPWALSADSIMLRARSVSQGWQASPFAAVTILRITRIRKSESAPCRVTLPTSSLSNTQAMSTCSDGFASSSARTEA